MSIPLRSDFAIFLVTSEHKVSFVLSSMVGASHSVMEAELLAASIYVTVYQTLHFAPK